MLSWIIQITLVSIILIFLVHHLIEFFKDTLTIPKIKDLVNSPTKKYENMFLTMKQGTMSYETDPHANYGTNYDENYKKSLLPVSNGASEPESDFDVTSMRDELKDYLKSQTAAAISGSSQISDLDLNFINSTQSTNW